MFRYIAFYPIDARLIFFCLYPGGAITESTAEVIINFPAPRASFALPADFSLLQPFHLLRLQCQTTFHGDPGPQADPKKSFVGIAADGRGVQVSFTEGFTHLAQVAFIKIRLRIFWGGGFGFAPSCRKSCRKSFTFLIARSWGERWVHRMNAALIG